MKIEQKKGIITEYDHFDDSFRITFDDNDADWIFERVCKNKKDFSLLKMGVTVILDTVSYNDHDDYTKWINRIQTHIKKPIHRPYKNLLKT